MKKIFASILCLCVLLGCSVTLLGQANSFNVRGTTNESYLVNMNTYNSNNIVILQNGRGMFHWIEGDTTTTNVFDIFGTTTGTTGRWHTVPIQNIGTNLLLISGTTNQPGLAWRNSTNTGWFLISTNEIGVVLTGTNWHKINPTSYIAPNGAVGTPSYTFLGSTNTGMFRSAANQIDFAANGATALSILAGGNTIVTDGNGLIIGNATQLTIDGITAELQSQGTTDSDSSSLWGRFSGDTACGILQVLKSRNATIGGFTIVADGDNIGALQFYADDGVDYNNSVARIDAGIDGTPGSNDTPGKLRFYTTSDGAATSTLRWTINALGYLESNGAGLIRSSTGALNLQSAGGNGNIISTPNGSGNTVIADGTGLIVGSTTQPTVNAIQQEFQILGTGSEDSAGVLGRWTADAGAPYQYFVKSRNAAIGSFTIVQNGDGVGGIRTFADDGADYNSEVGNISFEIDGTPGADDTPGRIVFSTTADNAASSTEAFRITSTQNILLSTNAEFSGSIAAAQSLSAGTATVANGMNIEVVGNGGAVTITATPSIADGVTGQHIYLIGTSDVNTVTYQDEGGLAGSNLQLAAATRLLGLGDVLHLMFNATAAAWIEVSFANN